MAVLTPGIDAIFTFSAALGAYVWCSSTAAVSLSARAGHNLPTWMAIAGALISIPAALTAKILFDKLSVRRRARAMGARVIPEVRGRLPWNLDVVEMIGERMENGYPGDGFNELLDEYGPVVNLRMGWTDLIMTTSPEHIKAMLATDFKNYVKGKRFNHNLGAVLGTGVFNVDGDLWKFHRSITRPMFTKERISHFELFDRRATHAISKLRTRLRTGYAVDFQDLMARFTLDAATEFLFGHCVDSLSAPLPYPHNAAAAAGAMDERTPHGDAADAFASAFLEAQEVITVRDMYDWFWPMTEMWCDKVRAPMKVVDAYIEPIVKEAFRKRAEMNSSEKMEDGADGDEETLLDYMMKVTDDHVVVKDEILNIMIAGRDTTAATLTFIIYALAQNPNVLTRLRDEILGKVGSTRRPDYDDIRDMKYLRAVINETLRLYPIVPFNLREAVNDTTWKSDDPTQKDYFVPGSARTMYSVFMMHRRKDLWGPDAEVFDPDRFLDARLKKYLSKNPFIFLPFNAGPRICLGQQFAYNEMSFMLVRLLQSFSAIELDLVSAPPGSLPPASWGEASGRKAIEKIQPKMHLTMYSNGGMWVKMKEAKEDSS